VVKDTAASLLRRSGLARTLTQETSRAPTSESASSGVSPAPAGADPVAYGEEEAFRLLRAELHRGEAVSVAPAERLAFAIEGPRLVAGDFAPRGSDDTQVIRDGRQHRL
jgi:hypothetical protein